MDLLALGVSHKTAPLELRERLVYGRDEALATLGRLKHELHLPQALLLSTCNRTEVYALAPDAKEATGILAETVFMRRLAESSSLGQEMVYTFEGESAVDHLYRVASGLDSLVLGEQQILGQVKHAFQLSQRAESAGSVLYRLANGAFRVGKRARNETGIGQGSVSIASVAVELAEKVFQNLAGKHALLVGAGENGLHCAQHLLARDVASLTITNRTAARAEALALKLGGEAVPFDQLEQGLAAADIVITTTGSPTPIIDEKLVRRAMRERDHVALVLLDIAVPRDIDVAVDHVPNVFRFDMDALEKITDRNLERRRREIPAVERIVRGEIDNFMRWWASLDAGPVIRDLHESFESIRAQELQKNAKRFFERDRAELETFSKNLVRKLLMDVTREIKQYRRDDPVEMERLAALRDVFHLGKNGNEDDSGDPSP